MRPPAGRARYSDGARHPCARRAGTPPRLLPFAQRHPRAPDSLKRRLKVDSPPLLPRLRPRSPAVPASPSMDKCALRSVCGEKNAYRKIFDSAKFHRGTKKDLPRQQLLREIVGSCRGKIDFCATIFSIFIFYFTQYIVFLRGFAHFVISRSPVQVRPVAPRKPPNKNSGFLLRLLPALPK